MPDFGPAERRMLSYFVKGTQLKYKDSIWTVVESDKPTCSAGEPKTDIYVSLQNAECIEEIKISYKKKNAEFLENKTSAERAEKIFGDDWRKIIERTTTSISSNFKNRMRAYTEKFGKTQKGSFTLGWKFELMLVPGGDLSGTIDFTYEQIFDVYAGTSLPKDKRDAMVNERIIKDSGVASHILHDDAEAISSAQDIIDRMVTIDEFIKIHPKIFFACKALNYRSFDDKYDGNRPLAVQVDWRIDDGKLVSDLVFDKPLELNGTEMANRLIKCMKAIEINNTDDLSNDNTDMKYVYTQGE